MPANIEDINVERIIEFRTRYGRSLVKFQNAINDIVEELPNLSHITTPSILKERLEFIHKAQIQSEFNELEESLKFSGIGVAKSLININIALPPAAVEMTNSIDSSVSPIVAAGGSLAFVLSNIISNRQHSLKEARNSRISYLLDVAHDIKPETSLRRATNRVRHFARKLAPKP